jgi:hypothetical protein
VNDPVVGLGASLAYPAIVHPAYRFALLALSADPEVPHIFENARCRTVDFGFGRSGRKLQPDHPGGDGRVWPVPVDLADEDADFIRIPLHANELFEKLAVIHQALVVAHPARSVVSVIRRHAESIAMSLLFIESEPRVEWAQPLVTLEAPVVGGIALY